MRAIRMTSRPERQRSRAGASGENTEINAKHPAQHSDVALYDGHLFYNVYIIRSVKRRLDVKHRRRTMIVQKLTIPLACLICLLLPFTAAAATINGTWQSAEDTARYVLKFQSTPKGIAGRFYVLGKDAAPQDLYEIAFDGQKVSLIAAARANQRGG
jgi:hypothetical protein